jgi:hypothetical protein
VPALAGEMPRKKKIAIERPAYDRKLEQAAIRIVARRIGELRGALATDIGPVLVVQNAEEVSSASDGANGAVAPVGLAVITC